MELAGEPIVAKLSHAAGNNAPIDGLKVIARGGWFEAQPSGTEAIYKIYAESFKNEAHLDDNRPRGAQDGKCRALGLGRTSYRERTGGMMDRGRAPAPFPPEYRGSGVLLHVTSLPSRHGIGDLGPSARAWVDRLADAGQSWWQSLPLGPTGYGNSPYQPLSSFAGNELLVSPEDLIEDGLLCSEDCAGSSFSPTAVDYAAVMPFKRRVFGPPGQLCCWEARRLAARVR